MTHNPTPAEVQVIYDHLRQIINGEDYAAQFPHVDTFLSVEILLAAVARDTLGWREVDAWQFVDHKGPAKSEPSGNKFRYWIKDAPT